MTGEEASAFLIVGGYIAAIFASFFLVFQSILSGIDARRLVSGPPFLFLRTGLGALLCTWYCEYIWSVKGFPDGAE